jgi:photosystem II stability/assembly factor-like uncharacterized protein
MINPSWLFKAIVLSANISTIAFAQWERQESGVSVTLQDVCFVDSLHGWAVGDSATIIATIDGGKTWQCQNSPIAEATLEKVFFVNKNVGYILGSIGYLPGRGSFILTTKNSGQCWQVSQGPVDYWLRGMSFLNVETGWVAGGDFLQTRRRGVILQTKDGGQSWQKQFETYSPSIFSSQLFSAVTFLNKQDGWAFASDFVDNFSLPNVYRTSDGGENWTIVGQASAHLSEMSMVSPDTIWGGGFSFGRSTDGGKSWNHRIWPSNYVVGVTDIEQIDGQKGWLVTGFITVSRKGGSRILFTKDGGTTFSEIFVDSSGLGVQAMTHYKKHLWGVGSAGVILHYKERPSRVGMPRNEIPQTFQLEQNFPNPFNSGTTIGFFVSKKLHVRITIYDFSGKEIAVLLSRILNPGTYSVTWDGTESQGIRSASGLYFYELHSAGLVLRRKMMLIN